MTEPIFLIIGIAIGYALCYISTQHAASATERALEVMTSAFNARFGVRTPVTHTKPETVATEPLKDNIITDEKDIPKKAQYDLKPPDLKSIRNAAIQAQERREKMEQNAGRMIGDHL